MSGIFVIRFMFIIDTSYVYTCLILNVYFHVPIKVGVKVFLIADTFQQELKRE